MSGKCFDKKTNTIRNNVECLHILDIFFMPIFFISGTYRII